MSSARIKLDEVGIDRREAPIILENSGGYTKTELLTLDRDISTSIVEAADACLARRLTGEPLAYIFGWKEFYGRRFQLNPSVLIPRPETELLVEAVLNEVQSGSCIDVGTGSGCVGITLALEAPHTTWVCTDVSADALNMAGRNVRQLQAEIHLVRADMLEAFRAQTFDTIVSNPPYIALGDPRVEPSVSKWEPSTALFSGDDGLSAIRRLIDGARYCLKPGGLIALEFGEGQADAIRGLLDGWHPDVRKDLAGIERFVLARLPS